VTKNASVSQRISEKTIPRLNRELRKQPAIISSKERKNKNSAY
jgi:hypothetical protein